MHRDIKPENLFLARKEGGEVVVKVLDFGIAKIRRTPENATGGGGMTAPAVPMTTSGQVLGTPLYMAPEQIDSAKNVDERSDVYSLGVTLYAMLAGGAARGDQVADAAPPRAHVRAASAARGARAVGALEVVAVVEKAMSADKEARYSDGGALLSAIASLLEGGTALREEMLVGIGEEQKKVVASGGERGAATAAVRGEKGADGLEKRAARPSLVWAVVIGLLLVGAVLGAVVLGR